MEEQIKETESQTTQTVVQAQPTKMSRQVRRAIERKMVRGHLTKKERRHLFREKNPLKREIFQETLRMIAEHFYSTGNFGHKNQ